MKKSKRVFIIAEAGVNHNGDIKIARSLVDAAAGAGADAVKFQTFRAERLVSLLAPKAEYQKKTTSAKESQFEMIKKLELDKKAHKAIKAYCAKKDILFLSSPFDLESIDLLDGLGLKIFKIPSGEITNLPYLKKIGSLKKKVIMSTGMAYLKEVKDAMDVLISEGTKKSDITLLHCNTAYPTPFKDVNLRAMITLQKIFKTKVGYSDHTAGIEASIAAVALGAVVIEKHITLDKNMSGPDHSASLDPVEFARLVGAIRNTEKALGGGVKKPSCSEAGNRKIVRKSIVAARLIKRGEMFSMQNITVKRPAGGISPMDLDKVLGYKAKKNTKKDELIRL